MTEPDDVTPRPEAHRQLCLLSDLKPTRDFARKSFEVVDAARSCDENQAHVDAGVSVGDDVSQARGFAHGVRARMRAIRAPSSESLAVTMSMFTMSGLARGELSEIAVSHARVPCTVQIELRQRVSLLRAVSSANALVDATAVADDGRQ